MNQPFRLRYTNQIVGAFLLVLLLFLILLALLLLRASDYFAEKKTYWFEIGQEEVQDLHPGVDVVILGQRAGQVTGIDYVNGGDRVRVNLEIDANRGDQIFDNSVIVPARKYGVGTPVLNVRRGAEPETSPAPLPNGSRIATFRSEDDRIERMAREVETVSDSVRLIQQRMMPTLDSIETTSDHISESLDRSVNPSLDQARVASESFLKSNEQLRPEASETLRVIREATTQLQSQVGVLTAKIEKLLDEDLKSTLADVRQSSDEISTAAKTANTTTVEVGDGVADTMATLKQAAEQVAQLAEETRAIVRIVRREADDLPGTTARVNDTVSETQDLVGEIRDHWLLRRSSNRASSSEQISPSTVRGGFAR
ncbi:MAG: hypothetical protein WBD31_23545 [Rubripirellula sp.]